MLLPVGYVGRVGQGWYAGPQSVNILPPNGGPLPSFVTVARASAATYFDATGTLQTAANDALRYDYNPVSLNPLGYLIEGQRTNQVINSSGSGAVAGTPGTLPTGWSTLGIAGPTRTIQSIAAINGIPRIRVNYAGTCTTTNANNTLRLHNTTDISASSGQTWTGSFYFAAVAGTTPGTCSIRLTGRTSGGTATTDSFTASMSVSSDFKRYTLTATLADVNTQRVSLDIDFGPMKNGVSYDWTFDIGAPQVEQAAFASSLVLTSGAAATRLVDSVSAPMSAFGFNQSEGTFYVNLMFNGQTTAGGQHILNINDGTNTGNISVFKRTDNVGIGASAGGVTMVGGSAAIQNNTLCKIGLRYKSGNNALYVNGVKITDAAFQNSVLSVTQTTLRLGNRTSNDREFFGTISSCMYRPVADSDTQMGAMTS